MLVESKNTITVIEDNIAIKIGHKNINILAIIFHKTLAGIMSQYPVVVIVTTAHRKVVGIELKSSLFHHFSSMKYTKVENIVNIISIRKIAAKYSVLCLFIPFTNFDIIGILSINSKILNTLKILNNAKM